MKTCNTMNIDKLIRILGEIAAESVAQLYDLRFIAEAGKLHASACVGGNEVHITWTPDPEERAFGVRYDWASYVNDIQDASPRTLLFFMEEQETMLDLIDDALVRAHKEYGEPEPPVRTKYYHFSQNNSGGDFVFSDGISVHVVIGALSAEHANERAVECGLYFDGVSEGRDCSCCGDRWCKASEHDAEDSPRIYGEPVGSPENIEWARRWAQGHPYAYVHHLDGRVESFT